MINKRIIFIFVLCLMLCICTVSALSINGSVSSSTFTSYNFGETHVITDNTAGDYSVFRMHNIENSNGFKSLIAFGNPGWANNNISGQVDCLFKIGGVTIGGGQWGYQRVYNSLGAETAATNIYIIINSWNPSGFTGDQTITLEFNGSRNNVPSTAETDFGWGTPTSGTYPNSYASFINSHVYSLCPSNIRYTQNYQVDFLNSYQVIQPNGLGITGSVYKSINGISYGSKVFVVSSSGNTIYASDNSLNANTFNFNIPTATIKLAINGFDGKWYNTSTLFLSNTTYSYSFSSNTTPLGIPVIGYLSSSTGDLNGIKYYSLRDVTEGTNHPLLYEPNGTYAYDFLKFSSDNNWYAYNGSLGYSTNLGSSIPNNLVINFVEGGLRTVKLIVIDLNEEEFDSYAYVTVSNAGQFTVTEIPLDYLNGNFVNGATIHVQDWQTKAWTNKTVNSPEDCKFLLNLGFYEIQGDAPNYRLTDNGIIYVSSSRTDQVILYPSIIGNATDINNSSVFLKLEKNDALLSPISGAQMTINGVTKITSQTGTAQFDLLNNTLYKVDVSANGFNSVSQYFTPNSNPYYLDIVTDVGNTPVTYYTTVPVTQPTPTPLPTTMLGLSGVNASAGSAGVCSSTPPQGFLQAIQNFLVCNGVTSQQGVNFVLAIGLVFAGLYFGGKFGGDLGSITGCAAVYVFDLMIGWIPLWTLIAFIVIAAFIMGLKIFVSSD